jgi:hypothetical protein
MTAPTPRPTTAPIRPRNRRTPGLIGAVALLAALALAGCGGSDTSTAGGTVTVSPTGSTTAPATNLTIVVVTDTSPATTWHLTCDPAGGDHPDPEQACAALDAHGEQALPPVPADRMCTEIYGGGQTARITGTWRGDPVQASFSRTDGCEIARWNALAGLLPQVTG